MTTREAPAPRHPMTIIREALSAAILAGLTVTTDAPNRGIHCISSHARNRWARDPRSQTVDVLGAVVLHVQPPQTDLDEAIAAALGTSIPYVMGFDCGLRHEEIDNRWTGAATRRWYLAGLEDGAMVRMAMLAPTASHLRVV